ncbi:MAG TPA: protein kinase [Chthoniobacterales bacterium]|nr:protein kinase [Chthoniobacterales bacterium]
MVGDSVCLHCLLRGGIAADDGETAVSPADFGRRFEHYEILARADGSPWELGRGAMGVTYKAIDVNLRVPVALKVINGRFSGQPGARQRFLREAQSAAQLWHPNVASVFHFGTVNLLPEPNGTTNAAGENIEVGDCFYAMEFIEGETLEKRLRRSGPLTPLLALELAVQVTRALAAAERRGLVHRDLKPSNIMLQAEEGGALGNDRRRASAEAWVKVIDFGLAKAATEADEPPASAHFLGTPQFASPEQIGGDEVDGRSDIYSLGSTLWYSLTGKVPFPNRSASELHRGAASPPPPVAQLVERNIPPSLIALLESMLANNPEDRPASAVALGEALQNCLENLAGVDSPAGASLRHGGRKRILAGALGLAAILAGLAVYFFWFAPAGNDKSIAVLPFENLSNDPANAFFAEGIQDDLLSRLVKIRDLRVISRNSAARYPANARRDLRDIGRTLGVRHVLEGSLRRTGDHVFLHVALIDTHDGHELWGERYARSLADAINLQGELASSIADALDATLSVRERMDLQSRPTRNADAYVLYFRGRKLESGPAGAIANFEAAQALYSQAIALDPGFALAHARLASALSMLYRNRGPSEDLKRRAHAEARAALHLQPDLGEAHLANALCAYRIERDYDRALPELMIARRLMPNDTEPESFVAFIHRRQGRWREARAGLERICALDPRNMSYEEELYATCCLTRDWAGTAVHAARAEALAPTLPSLKIERAMVELWKHGNLAPVQDALKNIAAASDPEGNVAWALWDGAMLSRDFGAAQTAIDGFPFETLPSVFGAPLPKSYLEGCIQLAQGNSSRAEELFEDARPSMEAEVVAHPDDGLRHARLGLLYAYMGRKAEARREGERAVQLQPPARDAYDGTERVCNLALIYARVGDADQAITMIESLLRKPGAIAFYEASMSLSELRLRWQWDPLRADPRFQKILENPEPPTVY